MVGPAIEVAGARDFRRELRALGPEWPKAKTKAERTLAGEVAGEARKFANASGAVQAHFSRMIFGHGSTLGAALGVRYPGTAAIFGAKQHTGWYADPRYNNSVRGNQPPWVGDTWEPGGAGGPYGLNDALRHDMPQILRRYDELIDALVRRAFDD